MTSHYDYDNTGNIATWSQSESGSYVVYDQVFQGWHTTQRTFGYNLSDEVTSESQKVMSYPNAPVAWAQHWSYDVGGNWLATGSSGNMSTRTLDSSTDMTKSMNRLMQIGGAGKTVVEGVLNEFAAVKVTSGVVGTDPAVDATLMTEPSGGYRFRAEVPVKEGSNTLAVVATDRDTPTAHVTTKNYAFNAGSLSRSFLYDLNGNMTDDFASGVLQRKFTWDAKNRLKTVTVGGNTTRWDYDYQDRRVKEYNYPSNAAPTALNFGNPNKLFVWDGDDLVQERTIQATSQTSQALWTAAITASGTNVTGTNATLTRSHLFGGFVDHSANGTAAVVKTYQTTTDHLGNVCEVVAGNAEAGGAGSLVARYDYSTFQGPRKDYSANYPVAAIDPNASLLTIGRYYHHAASGLELALYRAYDPTLGRWLSRDPMGEEGGINLYGMVGNDPVNGIDSLGMAPVTWSAISLADAKKQWQTGGGDPATMAMSLVDTSGVDMASEATVNTWLKAQKNWLPGCTAGTKTLTKLGVFYSPPGSGDAVTVLGSINLVFTGDVKIDCNCKFDIKGKFEANPDTYDFNMDITRPIRSVLTIGGRLYNGAGTPYKINFTGSNSFSQSGTQGLLGH